LPINAVSSAKLPATSNKIKGIRATADAYIVENLPIVD